MRLRTLRSRVVLAAALSILITVVALGVGVEVFVGRHLHNALDHTLRDRAAEIARLSVSAPALLTAAGTLDSPLGGRALSVEVLDRQGRIVARSLALGSLLLPENALVRNAIRDGQGGYDNATVGGNRLRVYVAPLADLHGPAAGGAVIVASSTSELAETLDRLRYILGISALVSALAAAVATAILLRRALHPLALLSTAAAEIERSGDVTRRLPAPETEDEVGTLAETLNDMLSSLEQAQERERRFVADASHELRTPLTALRGNMAFVARHGAAPDDDVVADLQSDTARMADLIESLLALSREDAAGAPGNIVRLDLLARQQGENDRTLTIHAPDPVPVRGDPEALARALVNLLENARQHGPAGGAITVIAEQKNGIARLSVSDDGPGPPRANSNAVFERFWRGGDGRPGSGLGLAIVRATAERHGGAVSVDGSRFTIELPALRELTEFGARRDALDREKGTP
jgi:two-component system, OmpR family, sensor kinase